MRSLVLALLFLSTSARADVVDPKGDGCGGCNEAPAGVSVASLGLGLLLAARLRAR